MRAVQNLIQLVAIDNAQVQDLVWVIDESQSYTAVPPGTLQSLPGRSVGWFPADYAASGATALATLGSDSPANIQVVTLQNFLPNIFLNITLRATVIIVVSATRNVSGSGDIVLDGNIATDGSGLPTVTFSAASSFVSRLPAGLVGATAAISATANGFTISATRPTGVPCKSWARWNIAEFLQVS